MVEINQQWDLPLEVRGVPHFYKIELRHSVDIRRIFVNGTEKLFDSSKTASDGSTEDLIKIGGAKITIRIEKHDEDFVYSLEVNRQRAFGHTADILKRYFIFLLGSREAVILEKVNNKLFNNGELLNNKWSKSGDLSTTSFTIGQKRCQLMRFDAGEVTLIANNQLVDFFKLETGDKRSKAGF